MAKIALCVGINEYPYKNRNLRGCVNDARAWASLLIELFDFHQADVTVLTDREATKENIITYLQQMIKIAQAGDVLVYTFAGHGTYVVDQDGDEADGFDEAQCPFYEKPYESTDQLILDDELRALFAQLPSDVHLTMVSDSCHSGTVSLVPFFDEQVRPRFLNPELIRKHLSESVSLVKAQYREKRVEKESPIILLAGCQDDQFAHDAWLGAEFYGVFSFHAIKLLRGESVKSLTYKDLIESVQARIGDSYDQKPRLTGKKSLFSRPLFQP
ncbi:MAG: caspase family protein [Chloroflexota bacterium]